MTKWIFTGLLIFSSLSYAETKTYNIEGMHCEGCAASIKEKVCALKDIEKCDVEVGKVTLTSKGVTPLDDKAIHSAVEAAGYKVVAAGAGDGDKMCGNDGAACGKKSCDHDKKSCGKDCGCHHKKSKKSKKHAA